MIYYMITNKGTFMRSPHLVRKWPYHMVLAQELLKDSDYMRTVADVCRRSDTVVILDNGAHEGEQVDMATYCDMAADIGPSVVVLTDIIGVDSVESRGVSLECRDLLDVSKYAGSYMYAAQGLSVSECAREYAWAMQTLPCDKHWIGFGQSYLTALQSDDSCQRDHEFARQTLLDAVYELVGSRCCHSYACHLLGARWTAPRAEWRRTWLASVDTVKPSKNAFAGTNYPSMVEAWCGLASGTQLSDVALAANVLQFALEWDCGPGQWLDHCVYALGRDKTRAILSELYCN